MADPIATHDDVTKRTNIDLDPDDINPYLEDAAFDLAQVNDITEIADDVRRQLEWRLAAIDILSTRIGSRAYHSQSLGSMNRSYEVRMVEELRRKVGQITEQNDLENPLDAGVRGGVKVDTDRFVRATNPEQ